MKIHFDGCDLSLTTGPNTAGRRLARKFIELGHDVTFDGANADVSLVFIEPTGRPLAKKIVQRLDGVWFRPSEFATKNTRIRSLYNSADFVIWQSSFDRNFTCYWWDTQRGAVINNGIELVKSTSPKNLDLQRIRQEFDKVFVCSANWHGQKRLRANMELFDHITKFEPDKKSCLIVMGSNPDCSPVDNRIFYTGSLPEELCLEIFAAADWMLHTAWLDHCPNVVVEALSQGCPVICTDAGGTQELVKEYGVVLRDQPYANELVEYDQPPRIDLSQLTSLPHRSILGQHANIDINDIAQRYLDVLQRVVDEG